MTLTGVAASIALIGTLAPGTPVHAFDTSRLSCLRPRCTDFVYIIANC